mmetsp:Transcript_98067/g.261870  ORF Transcript_98067/g.261870 Transcript_98067/m.261870 type:complete len:516 (+) Transcript_98067:64-1611(+)
MKCAVFGLFSVSVNAEVLEVSSAGSVLSLAEMQAKYWRSSTEELSAVSSRVNQTSDNVAEKVDEFLRNQVSSDHACHAKLYRYRNMLNHLHEDVNLVYSKEKALVQTITSEEAVIGDLQTQIKNLKEEAAEKRKACKQAREEACAQYEMYGKELKELKQIGQSPQQPLALFQSVLRRASRKQPNGLSLLGITSGSTATLSSRRLVSSVRELQACIAQSGDMSALQLSGGQPEEFAPTGEEVSEHSFDNTVTFGPKRCEKERKKLEDAWRKAFMTIEDLVETSQSACEDDSCEKAVEAEIESQLPPLNDEVSQRITVIREAQRDLAGVRAEMSTLEDTLAKVEAATKDTQEECGAAETGSKYLENVRELLENMKRCPGLAGATFEVPHFASLADVLNLAVTTDSHDATDEKLTKACQDAAGEGKEDVRAATQAELRAGLVEGLPETNGQSTPMYGTCPGCRGEKYAGAASGNLRRCFKSGAKLSGKEESKDCDDQFAQAVCVKDLSLAEHQATRDA